MVPLVSSGNLATCSRVVLQDAIHFMPGSLATKHRRRLQVRAQGLVSRQIRVGLPVVTHHSPDYA